MLASIARVLGLVMVAIAGLLHLWYRGVLAVPEVKRRKATRRLAASVAGKAVDARPVDRPPTAVPPARRA